MNDHGYDSYKRKSGFNAMANGYGSHPRQSKQVDDCKAGIGSGKLHKCNFSNMPTNQRDAASDRSIKSDEEIKFQYGSPKEGA